MKQPDNKDSTDKAEFEELPVINKKSNSIQII